MELRWTQAAAADLDRIADYLTEHAPSRARELVREIYEASAALPDFPRRGRPGKKDGTRELVLTPLPYLVVYTVRDDVLFIVRILHGAQQWPPAGR